MPKAKRKHSSSPHVSKKRGSRLTKRKQHIFSFKYFFIGFGVLFLVILVKFHSISPDKPLVLGASTLLADQGPETGGGDFEGTSGGSGGTSTTGSIPPQTF